MARSLSFLTRLSCLTAAMGLLLGGLAYSQSAPAEKPATTEAAAPSATTSAPAATSNTVTDPEVVPAVATAAVAVMQPGPAGNDNLPLGANYHAVNLNQQGAITGRVTLIDGQTGQRVPTMDVVVNFVQFGRIVAQARPGQNGEFVVGLRPGVYSVIVSGPGGFGAFSVMVQPYDQNAPPEASQLLLDGTLVPPSDMEIVAGLANRNLGIFAPPFNGAGGAAGGGGFGGGGGGGTGAGGLGSLLGLAGLGAGIAAIANDDDNNAVVSPPASPAAP